MNEKIQNIIKNGGATLNNDLSNANIDNGYMVSMSGYEKVILLDSFKSVLEIEKTLKEYQCLSKKIGAFIGLWVNNGNIYIDLSKNYKRLKNAIKTGKNNNQLGIFDLNNMNEIFL